MLLREPEEPFWHQELWVVVEPEYPFWTIWTAQCSWHDPPCFILFVFLFFNVALSLPGRIEGKILGGLLPFCDVLHE